MENAQKCPFCNDSLDAGFIWGVSRGLLPLQNKAFVWFDGEARTPGIGDSGIPVGNAAFTGSTAAGFRCPKCRKIILDY